MKILYIDCGMGAAGDMLTAALLELFDNKEEMLARLNNMGIPGVTFSVSKASKCGIGGTHMHVSINGVEEAEMDHHEHHHEHTHEDGTVHSHDHHHHDHDHDHHHDHDHDHHHDHHEHDHHHDHHHEHFHASMAEIEHIIDSLNVSDSVKDKAKNVYKLIAEAESTVHGVPVSDIHFHEVGKMDAIADITAVSFLLEELKVDKVIASPIHVGSGTVKCAHGILPVPAPATALILENVPMYGGEIKGELCTPTGAALVKTNVDEFGNMPLIETKKIGYGVGNKDFERANIIRAILGEAVDLDAKKATDEFATDGIAELSCNLDDMTAEMIGFAMEELMAAGALDVYTMPIGMKKNRPGIMLSVLCKCEDREKMAELIFRHTTTIGIRETLHNRYILNRSEKVAETKFGPVRVKEVSGFGVSRQKYEYEDVARIARNLNMGYQDVIDAID